MNFYLKFELTASLLEIVSSASYKNPLAEAGVQKAIVQCFNSYVKVFYE